MLLLLPGGDTFSGQGPQASPHDRTHTCVVSPHHIIIIHTSSSGGAFKTNFGVCRAPVPECSSCPAAYFGGQLSSLPFSLNHVPVILSSSPGFPSQR